MPSPHQLFAHGWLTGFAFAACVLVSGCEDTGGSGGSVDGVGAGDGASAIDADAAADSALDAAGGDSADSGASDTDAGDPDGDGPGGDGSGGDGSDSFGADATSDSQTPKPFPPVVLGPPYASYDCSAAGQELPSRLSPVPLSCVFDSECSAPMVVGHRGAGGDFGAVAPENSLAAIRAAILLGLDGVELDVRETSDDVLVLMHDGEVDRTTQGQGKVSGMTAAEVGELALKAPPLGVGGDFSCERVPTFADALALAKGRLFVVVDTKTSRVDLVVDALVAADMVDQAVVSTAEFDRAQAARALWPAIRVQVRPNTMEEVLAATAAFEPPPDIYEIEPDIAVDAAPHVHGLGRKLFANSWSFDALYYVDEAPAHYLDVYANGVDILQSEFPVQVLQALGRWP